MSEVILWGALFLVGIIVFGLAVFYLIRKVSKFGFLSRIKNAKVAYGISALLIVAFFTVFAIIFTGLNSAIIILHVLLFWFIGDLINLICRRKFSRGQVFITTLVITFIYLGISMYLCFHVSKTEYSLDTDKDVGTIRIVQFADSHIGTTFDGEGINQYVDMINECNPDVVLITGDFVDDGTTHDEMIDACEALGRLETTYGVYYSFGNHDKGYSDSSHRGFTGDDLVANLEANGVVVLEDEAVLIDDRFYIVGRQDRSEEQRGGERAPIAELVEELDQSKYIIVMDHQPNDYDAEAATASDLVLSGHTHGGQMLPINEVGVWIGANDATYGHRNIDGTDFIVTSGISDWEVLFKSGCYSEFVVIDIN